MVTVGSVPVLRAARIAEEETSSERVVHSVLTSYFWLYYTFFVTDPERPSNVNFRSTEVPVK